MAIAFINATSATSATGTTITGSEPSGVTSTSVQIAVVTNYDDNTITSTPTDGTWTEIAAAAATVATTNLIHARVYYHIGSASSYVWTMSATTYSELGIVAYSGVDTSTPVDCTSTGNSGTTAGSTRTGLSVTTVSDNAWLVLLTMGYVSAINTPPSGMTQRVAWDMVNNIYDLALGTAGATGNKTAVQFGPDSWTASMVALRPSVIALPRGMVIYSPIPLAQMEV